MDRQAPPNDILQPVEVLARWPFPKQWESPSDKNDSLELGDAVVQSTDDLGRVKISFLHKGVVVCELASSGEVSIKSRLENDEAAQEFWNSVWNYITSNPLFKSSDPWLREALRKIKDELHQSGDKPPED